MTTFLGTLFIVVCVLLILVVLLQKGRGGGLGAAFGGAGSSAFGTRTGDVFTWVTIVLTALFLLLAIFTTILHRPALTTITIVGFVPPGGTKIDKDITVRVVGLEPRDADVYYTLDGSDPNEKSSVYSKVGVRVKPGQTLKVRAYKGGCKTTKVWPAEYPRLVIEPLTPRKVEPPTRPVTRPTTKPATRPTTQPATKPATKPAAKGPTRPATKPAAKPASRPASKPASKPAAAPAAKKGPLTARKPTPAAAGLG